MSDIETMIQQKIQSKKVMVFAKMSCPFCRQAISVLSKYNLSADEYEVMEIDKDPKCSEIQDYLAKLTGARTVPRVFINGKCIGGGSETAALDNKGELKKLLGK